MPNNSHQHTRSWRLEHRGQTPASRARFAARLAWYVASAATLILAALGVGILGYHGFENLSWIDSFLNAAMILGGMGPVAELKTDAGKIFAGMYALFAGILFLVTAGILFTPLVHRLLHRFHFNPDKD
jgi:hypothetical protein